MNLQELEEFVAADNDGDDSTDDEARDHHAHELESSFAEMDVASVASLTPRTVESQRGFFGGVLNDKQVREPFPRSPNHFLVKYPNPI